MDVHVGRQPLFDRDGRVAGHELLFRDGPVSHARVTSGTAATAQVILSAFLDLGLQQLVGNGLAFLNLPRPFVTGALPLPPVSDRLVLEVLEDVGHDDELRAAVRRLHDQGARLALDDFVWTTESAALLPYVEFVKVDVLQHGEGVPGLVRRCRDAGCEVVAEKIETAEQLRLCRELGVQYFQGYLLQRPEVLRGRSLSPRQLSCLAVVRALQRPDVRVDELVELVRRDPGLSYRLLRAAGSARSGVSRKVTVLREALVIMGFAQLRRWALLMLAADLPDEGAAGIEAAFVRAAMCERMARGEAGADPEEAFVVGLLSSLDQLLGQAIEEVLEQLPLAPATQAAVLGREGPLGEVLSCVIAYEEGVLAVPASSGLPETAPREAFLDALVVTAQQQLLTR